MTDWRDALRGDPLPWLLEKDEDQPGVRYFTLRDILGKPGDDKELRQAKKAVYLTGPVPKILAAQHPDGWWAKEGSGYSPKYRSTVWQIMFLARLGADSSDRRVNAGCEYLLGHSLSPNGWISYNAKPGTFIHCLAGNLESALIDLGYKEDERLKVALEKHARFATGHGVAKMGDKNTEERFYSYTPGPNFVCGPDANLSCAWGAVKSLDAFGKVPASKRSKELNEAIETGVDFLLSRDPATADYPTRDGAKPSSDWFHFGFPLGYTSDVLQVLEVMASLGRLKDPRLEHAIEFVLRKQDEQGRWKMAYSLNGKMWGDVEKKGQPSKWVTLRALRMLKSAYSD